MNFQKIANTLDGLTARDATLDGQKLTPGAFKATAELSAAPLVFDFHYTENGAKHFVTGHYSPPVNGRELGKESVRVDGVLQRNGGKVGLARKGTWPPRVQVRFRWNDEQNVPHELLVVFKISLGKALSLGKLLDVAGDLS